MEVVRNLERVLMPHLQRLREGPCADSPRLEHRVYSNSGDDLTPTPWRVMGVSCLLHRDRDAPPGEVMPQVAALPPKSGPTVEAYVMWDYIMSPVSARPRRPAPTDEARIPQGVPLQRLI